MPSNAQIMSLVAQAIVEGSNLGADHALSSLVDPSDVNFESRFQLFIGQILKIKHSFLWANAPLTMRYLAHEAIGLNVFAAYSGYLHLSDLPSINVAERTVRFLSFLTKKELVAPILPHDRLLGICGLAMHELYLWTTLQEKATGQNFTDQSLLDAPETRMRLSSRIAVCAFDVDPRLGVACQVVDFADAQTVLLYTHHGALPVEDPNHIRLLSLAKDGTSVSDCLTALPLARSYVIATFTRWHKNEWMSVEQVFR